jgi:hypothetical protein
MRVLAGLPCLRAHRKKKVTLQTHSSMRLADDPPQNDIAAVVTQYSVQSSSLLIVFGGILGGFGVPPFEFLNLTSEFRVKKILVRDVYQCWYHRGLPGIAETIDGVADYLRRQILEQESRHVVLCGNSMGGYAAMLFGFLLQADVVHAFSPQTFLGCIRRLSALDFRWQKQINRMYLHGVGRNPYLDLRMAYRSIGNTKTQAYLHFSTSDRLDRAHAANMRGLENVSLLPYPKGGHQLVKYLKETGRLKDLLESSLEIHGRRNESVPLS